MRHHVIPSGNILQLSANQLSNRDDIFNPAPDDCKQAQESEELSDTSSVEESSEIEEDSLSEMSWSKICIRIPACNCGRRQKGKIWCSVSRR